MRKIIQAITERLPFGSPEAGSDYNLLLKGALNPPRPPASHGGNGKGPHAAPPVKPVPEGTEPPGPSPEPPPRPRIDARTLELPMTRLLISRAGPSPEERNTLKRSAEISFGLHAGVILVVAFFLIILPLIKPEQLTELILTLQAPPAPQVEQFPEADIHQDTTVYKEDSLVKEAGQAGGAKEAKPGGGGGGGGSLPDVKPQSHDYGDAKGFVPKPIKDAFDMPELEPDAPILPTGMAVPPPPNISNLMPSNKLVDGPIVPDHVPEVIGGGTGTGVGSGRGSGWGPGSGGGWGGGTGGGRGPGTGRGSGPGDGDGIGYAKAGDPGVQAPQAIFKPNPKFTDEAIQRRVTGVVLLVGIVRENGRMDTIRVLRGLGYGLDESAQQTVLTKWKFKPGMKDGRPVACQVTIEVVFQLY